MKVDWMVAFGIPKFKLIIINWYEKTATDKVVALRFTSMTSMARAPHAPPPPRSYATDSHIDFAWSQE